MARKRTPPGDAPAAPENTAPTPPEVPAEPKAVDVTAAALLQMLGRATPVAGATQPGAGGPLPEGIDASARVEDLTVEDLLRLIEASRRAG